MFDPVDEANRVLAACNITTWQQKVSALSHRLGRAPTLDELTTLAKTHQLSATEIDEQRRSWARQMQD